MGLLDRFNGGKSPLSRDFYGGAAGAQYRRQEEAYGQALRILRRKARRGDASAALAEIRTREDALDKGFMAGGIRSFEDRTKAAQDFSKGLADRARARGVAADLVEQRNREELDALRGGGLGADDGNGAAATGLAPGSGAGVMLGGDQSVSLGAGGLRTGSLSDPARRLGGSEDDELQSILGRSRLGVNERTLQKTRPVGQGEDEEDRPGLLGRFSAGLRRLQQTRRLGQTSGY